MSDEQLPFDLGELDGPAPVGLVEKAYRRALAAVTDPDSPEGGPTLVDADAGMAGLTLALAAAVDQAGQRRDARGLALVAKELRETSARLNLDPTARGSVSDPIGALLAKLSEPERSAPPLGDSPNA